MNKKNPRTVIEMVSMTAKPRSEHVLKHMVGSCHFF